MDLLGLLRALTLVARLLLAGALLTVVLRRANRLSPTSWRAWVAVTVVYTVLAADNAVLEVLAAAVRDLPAYARLRWVQFFFYNATYLLHAVLSAALPAVLVAAAGAGRVRTIALLGAAAAVLVGAEGVAGGALETWDRLLRSTRVLSFLGLTAYLSFLGLLLLGWLSGLDRYLVWFIGVRTAFVVLVPIQEVFFEAVGQAEARQLWHLPQFLQFAVAATQLGIVILLLRALRGGRGVPPMRLASPAADAGLRP